MNLKTDNTKIRIEVTLSVSPETAWQVLTQEQHIAGWWGHHVRLESKAGGAFREEWNDGGKKVITSGTITSFKPPSELKMTWADDDWPGTTNILFSLSETNNGTEILLEHSGWEIHPEDKRQNLMDAHMKGWSHYLHRFAEYTTEI